MKKGTTMNRLFKGIIVLLALTLSLTALSGCSQAAPTTLNASYFLQNTGNFGVGNVSETVNYQVTFTQNTDSVDQGLLIAVKSGTYTTVLTNTTHPETQAECYKLETTLNMEVEYTLGETVLPVKSDTIKTTTYFLGLKDNFKVITSERHAKTSAPQKNSNGFVINDYEYEIKTTYTANSASVAFTPIAGNFNQPEGTKTYNKLDKPAYYFDNEVMLFIGRAINFTDTSSLAFESIDALSGTLRKMKISSNTATPSETIKFKSEAIPHAYMVNGSAMEITDEETQQNLPCRVVNFAIDGTFTGTPITCWYTNTSVEKGYARLIKMQTSAPYGLGTFTYIVKDATYLD